MAKHSPWQRLSAWSRRFADHAPLRWIVTINLGDGDWDRKAAMLTRLAHVGFKVICCQEGSDRQVQLLHWCQKNGFIYYPGNGSLGAAAVPILVHKSQTIQSKGTIEAHDSANAGPEGAGPNVVKRKVINWVRLAGGWHIDNTHLVASSSYAQRRRPLYRRHIEAARRWLSSKRCSVVFVGDFNAEASYSYLAPLRRFLTQHVKAPTFDKRTIDLIWTKGCYVVKVVVLDVASDHNAAGVVVTKTKKRWNRLSVEKDFQPAEVEVLTT